MNALVGQEAKSNFSLFLIVAGERADDGRRKDGGDSSCRASQCLSSPVSLNALGRRHVKSYRQFARFTLHFTFDRLASIVCV
jgi:hypothetical protein